MELKTQINKAYIEHYAIGAFNFYNLESAQAVADAANAVGKPVIMMITETTIEYAGLDEIINIFNTVRDNSKTPLFLHLDHGKDIGIIKECISRKFDSVMFDGSTQPFEQNVIVSTELRRAAHRKGVVFEAEIGKIGGCEDNVSSELFKTNPSEALRFFEQVKPDMLAVAIGNVHGVKTSSEQLDFSLLAKIQNTIKAPIVLHGCSNRAPREYSVAIGEGVVKINIDTELRQTFVESVKRSIRKATDPREILGQARENIKKRALEKIRIFSKPCC